MTGSRKPLLSLLLLIVTAISITSCAGSGGAAAALPRSVEGGWELKSSDPAPPSLVPPEITQREPKNAVRAVYSGPSTVSVMLFEMQADASAFALMQSWRPTEKSQPFYKGKWFGYAEGSDANVLIPFVRAFEKSLPR